MIAKLNPKIYYYLLEKYGLNPTEGLFIDDREENVRGTEVGGFYGIVFRNNFEEIRMDYLRT